MTVAELHSLLASFAAGEIRASDFQRRLGSHIVDGSPELALPGGPLVEVASERLISEVVFYLEEERESEKTWQEDAGAAAAAVATLSAPAAVNMLPLIRHRVRLARIDRYCDGVISRTNFVAAVSESGVATTFKELWLGSSGDVLRDLASSLRTNDFGRVYELFERATA